MIFFLYGPDTYRSRQKLNELKEKFISELDQSAQSLLVIDGKSTNLKEINEKINSGSLFVKRRMVVIENVLENKSEKFLGELKLFLQARKDDEKEDKSDNIIIFRDEDISSKDLKLKKEGKQLAQILLKQKYVQEFKLLSPGQLSDYIKQLTTSYSRRISNEAINQLASRTNSDLWRIATELHKLAMLVQDDQEITVASVKENVKGLLDENIFSLTDALANRQKQLSIKLLEEQYLAGLSEEYILSMLIRQFKILLQLKAALATSTSSTQIASDLKLHPYVVKKSLIQAKLFTITELKNLFNQLIQLDYNNKTGKSDLKSDLALFTSQL